MATFFHYVGVMLTNFTPPVERISMYQRSALFIVHFNSVNVVIIYEITVSGSNVGFRSAFPG